MSVSELYFYGTALLAAGCFLVILSYSLAARYVYERNHATGAGSGCVLCLLLTCYVAASCAVVIVAHSRDTTHFCNILASALGPLTPTPTAT